MLEKMTAIQYHQITMEELTLLHHIAFSGNREALEYMVSLPYFQSIVDENSNEVPPYLLILQEGWTPLLWAASKKHLSIVKALIENGADIRKTKKDGMGVMHIAASQNDIHMLDYVMRTGLVKDINAQNIEVSY